MRGGQFDLTFRFVQVTLPPLYHPHWFYSRMIISHESRGAKSEPLQGDGE
jgi:hypothetical protein